MIIPSNYEINVAVLDPEPTWDHKPRYLHFCRIELGSCQEAEARIKFDDIAKRFPAPQFDLTLSYVVCRGTQIATNSF